MLIQIGIVKVCFEFSSLTFYLDLTSCKKNQKNVFYIEGKMLININIPVKYSDFREIKSFLRLSGEKIFEEKASRAMDYLWAARHRYLV